MEKNEKDLKKKLIIKILIIIILLILIVLTSFRTGRKFFILKNTYFGNSTGEVESNVARWNFNARVIIDD